MASVDSDNGMVSYMASVARIHGLFFTRPALINLLGLAIYIARVNKSNGKLQPATIISLMEEVFCTASVNRSDGRCITDCQVP